MSKKIRKITTAKTFALLIISIFKFIAFPIRKPLIGIPFIFLLFIIPTFRGIKPSEVHLWYLSKLEPVTQVFVNFGEAVNKHSIDPIKETVSKIVNSDGRYISDDTRLRTSTDLEPRKNENYIDNNNKKNLSSRIFEKAKNSSTTYKVEDSIIATSKDLLQKEEDIKEKISDINYNPKNKITEDIKENNQKKEAIIKSDKIEKIVIKPAKKEEKTVEIIKKPNPGLRYIIKPEFIEGKAKIKNANTIVINKRKIYLHGVYVDPYSEKGMAAITYLINLIHDKNVRCDVIAYTYNDFPTAICYCGGKTINEELVNVGLSQKVELN
jgi:hypothetical protein